MHSAATLNELCAIRVRESRVLNSTKYGGVEYLGEYFFTKGNTQGVDCRITPSRSSGYGSIGFGPDCKEVGYFSTERPDGCYKEVDCNSTFPEGQIPEVCRAPEPDPCDPSKENIQCINPKIKPKTSFEQGDEE